MIPTPDLSHLKKQDFQTVYEPAEDTFLLLDALEEDATALRALQPQICLEIGSGSGCVSSFMGKVLGATSSLFLATDINSHASLCTHLTGKQNEIPIEPITASLAYPLLSRVTHAVDVLIFNPPYVPTDESEGHLAQAGECIQSAWAGGADGMRVTNQLLEHVDDMLSPRGRFYLVAVTENNIPFIQQQMFQRFNLESKVIFQRRAGREHLHVICFSRQIF